MIKLIFKEHIESIQTKCIKYTRCLYPLINRNSKLCLKNKLFIYKQIFRPAMLYDVPIWSSCCSTRKKTLHRIQKKSEFRIQDSESGSGFRILKMILKRPPWFGTLELHRLTGVEILEAM